MKATLLRKSKRGDRWPRQVTVGRVSVTVYRRTTPVGKPGFMVVNYANGKRRFDSYADEAEALEAAGRLARQLSERDVIGASMTRDEALEYASARQALGPFKVTVSAAAAAVAESLKTLGDLSNLHAAVKFYSARFKQTVKKPVPEVVAEFLQIKAARAASERYLRDLAGRLNRFAADCNKDCCNVTTADLQDWLDGLKLSPQSYHNYRTVLHTLFHFAVAKGYAADNPVEGAEKLKVRNGDVEIFTPVEIARLLEAARAKFPDFLPCIAIGAFAGLRSAEIERLTWQDIDLTARHIIVAASKAKTASRRIVPIHDNLAAWLALCRATRQALERHLAGILQAAG